MTLILVVEDDPALGTFLQEALEDEGYTILRALNGVDALNQLATVHPHLILCDLLMPAMNGIAFCMRVQADPRLAHIPVVLCSAGKADLDIGACHFTAFLRKPFSLQELLAIVQRTLTDRKQAA